MKCHKMHRSNSTDMILRPTLHPVMTHRSSIYLPFCTQLTYECRPPTAVDAEWVWATISCDVPTLNEAVARQVRQRSGGTKIYLLVSQLIAIDIALPWQPDQKQFVGGRYFGDRRLYVMNFRVRVTAI